MDDQEVFRLKMSVDPVGDVRVVRLQSSRLVYPDLAGFTSELSQLIDAGHVKLILDFSRVSYIDSASLGGIMELYHRATDSTGSVKLIGLNNRVQTMISLVGLQHLVEIYREEDSALASFSMSSLPLTAPSGRR